MLHYHCAIGAKRVGYTQMIHADGFNGIADIILAVALNWKISARLKDGKRYAGMKGLYGKIANLLITTAVKSSARPYCIGLMIPG